MRGRDKCVFRRETGKDHSDHRLADSLPMVDPCLGLWPRFNDDPEAYIGSTAAPGLRAMDWLDAMVHIWTPVDFNVNPLANAGYGSDPRRWNRVEVLGAASHPKGVRGSG